MAEAETDNLLEQFKQNVLKSLQSPNTLKRSLSHLSDDSNVSQSPLKKQRTSNHNNNDSINDDIEFNKIFEIEETESIQSNEIDSNTLFHDNKFRTMRYFDIDNGEETQDSEIMNKMRTRPTKKNITFKCYNCNEVGHIARNCPHEEMIVCFQCGESGHSGFYCPNRVCSFCLKDHPLFECNRISQNKESFKFCIRCGSNTHYLNQCDALLNHRLLKLQCYVCGEFGHLNCKAMNCKKKKKRIQLCSNCGDNGHCVYFCPHLKMDKSDIAIGLCTAPNDPKICFVCLTPDHDARNCPITIRQKQQRQRINVKKFHYRRKEKKKLTTARNVKSMQKQWREDSMKMIKQFGKNKKERLKKERAFIRQQNNILHINS